MKTRSGTGGQQNWHNCSYISASYCGIITGENGMVRLSAEELESAFAIAAPSVGAAMHWRRSSGRIPNRPKQHWSPQALEVSIVLL